MHEVDDKSPAEPLPPAEPSPVDALVDRWFLEHFHNVEAVLPSGVFDKFTAAREALKAQLAAHLKES